MRTSIAPSRKDVTAFALSFRARLNKERKFSHNIFYGRPPCESENWDYYERAKSLVIQFGTSDEAWIESQFHYFKRHKSGFTPRPFHLCSKGAEERYRSFKRAFAVTEFIEEEGKLLKKLMKIWELSEKEVLERFGANQGLFSKEFVESKTEESNVKLR